MRASFDGANMDHAVNNRAFRYNLSDGTPLRSVYVALVVGTILNLNQGDVLFGPARINWIKIVPTYFVPYAVSTYGPVAYGLSIPPK